PAAQETLLATFPSLDAAASATFAADERGLALRAIALQPQHAGNALAACWLAGPSAAVERTARELAELASGAETHRLAGAESERWWAQVEQTVATEESGVGLRASLPPSAVAGFMQGLEALGHGDAATVTSLSYPTTGLVLARLGDAPVERLVDLIEAARRLATEAGGSLVVTAAPVAVKERVDVWGDTDALSLTRRLKQEFDPRSTLNPGRFVGGL
ncbi:MAG: hypothetical protein IIC88_04945, partial [Chloroflexi bacterium]|nr:hypothetical protein [Chloroflexota bacterium]